MKGKRVKWWGAIGALCLAALLPACSPGGAAAPPPTPTPLPTAVVPDKPTYTVQRGAVVDSLSFTARVSPVREAALYFRADGRVLAVYAARGDKVAAGQRLAELDVSALRRQVAQAELALAAERSGLARARVGRDYGLARARLDLALEQIALGKLRAYDPRLDVAAAQAELDRATTDLQRAQSAYDAVAQLPDVGMRPEAEWLQQATLSHAVARAARDRAAGQAAQHAFDVQSQEKRVALAQLEVDRLLAENDALAEQAVARAELALADLRAQVTDTLVVAPFDGQVAVVNVAAGQAVEAFEPVLVLADPGVLEVTAELGPDDMQVLSEGQPATTVPAGLPGQTLAGTIRSLPYPYGSGGGSASMAGADRATHVAVDLKDVPVKPGDLVRVTVVLAEKENVLWLPPGALRTFEGRRFAVVQEGAVQRRVDVTVGIESDERVEIVAGLAEGQVVVGP